MSAKRWFLLDKAVQGPMTLDDIELVLAHKKDVQIWGKGMSEWLSPDKWRLYLEQQTGFQQQRQEESSALGLNWKLRVEGEEKGPYTFQQLISELRKKVDFSRVDLWNIKSGTWREIYAFNSVVDELGISRRSHPRVPIVGMVSCDTEQGLVKIPMVTISEGGLGLSESKHLQIGEKFKVTITSPNLYVTINASVEVVYIGADSYTGLKFLTVTAEAKNSIIEYVKKFETY